MSRLTKLERSAGYYVTRGAYYGTTDDRADRWYLVEIDSDVIDRRGEGYRTKAESLAALAAIVREVFA